MLRGIEVPFQELRRLLRLFFLDGVKDFQMLGESFAMAEVAWRKLQTDQHLRGFEISEDVVDQAAAQGAQEGLVQIPVELGSPLGFVAQIGG